MATINAIGSNKPIQVTFGGTGDASLTAHSVLVGEGTSAVNPIAVGTNGMVLIAASAADPAFASITSSGGTITFTPGANTLNLEASYTQTARPAFSAVLAANTGGVTGDGTVYTVICTTKLYDQATNYNAGTGVFTAPATGIYSFSAYVSASATLPANTTGNVSIVTTGGTFFVIDCNLASFADIGTSLIFGGTTQIRMNAGDTASMALTVYGNATKNIIVQCIPATTIYITYFSGYQVC